MRLLAAGLASARSNVNDLLRVAFHESGHAAAALVFGGVVREIVLTENGGACRVEFSQRLDARASRAYTAAGPVCECRYLGLPYRAPLDSKRWAGDAQLLSDGVTLSFRLDSPAGRRAYELTLATASVIVDLHWREITAMAHALVARGRLSGFDLLGLVRIDPMDCLPDDPICEADEALAEQSLRNYNARARDFEIAMRPRANHNRDRTMTHFEKAAIGQSGTRASMRADVITHAQQVQAAVVAGRVARGSVAAAAANLAMDLAKRGDLGAPLLIELERRMGVAA